MYRFGQIVRRGTSCFGLDEARSEYPSGPPNPKNAHVKKVVYEFILNNCLIFA